MRYLELETAKVMSEAVLKEGMDAFFKALENPFIKGRLRKTNHSHYIGIVNPVMPKIVWKKKGFGVAGSASPMEDTIEMNLNYLESKDALQFVRNTTLHELAHILNAFYGGRNHDKQWKYICHLIGDDGGRCHNYSMPENRPAKDKKELICTVCGKHFQVTAYKYNRFQQYRCRCNGELIQG